MEIHANYKSACVLRMEHWHQALVCAAVQIDQVVPLSI